MFAQKAHVIGAVEVFESRGIPPELLVIVPNSSRVLHPAMDHFCFLVALELKLDWDENSDREYAHQRDHQKQRQQNIAVLPAAWPVLQRTCV